MIEGRLSVALLGCGRIARLAHLRELSAMAGVEVVALADPDEHCLREATRLAPHARSFSDYRTTIAQAGTDAVVICLPPALHAPAAVAALEAGKHVYLEKPIATDAAGAEDVLRAARAARRTAAVGFNYRFHPAVVAARRAIAAGEIGTVVAARSVFSAAPRPHPEWKHRRSSGGGALLNLGSHHLDLAVHLLGERVVAVDAQLRTLHTEDDTAAVTLRLESGVLVQSFFSMVAAAEDRWEITGTEGRLALDRYRNDLRRLPLTAPSRRTTLLRAEVGMATGRLWRALRHRHEPSYQRSLAAFVDAAARNAPAQPSLEDGANSLRLVLAAEQAAESGRTVDLDAPATVPS